MEREALYNLKNHNPKPRTFFGIDEYITPCIIEGIIIKVWGIDQ